METLILVVLGVLGAFLVGRYVYRIVVKGESDCCSRCAHNCDGVKGSDCSTGVPPKKQ